MLNMFRVIALEPLDIKGQHYDAGDVITLHADDCAPLLVMGRVRLETTPEPPPKKRPRGRPRKSAPVQVEA